MCESSQMAAYSSCAFEFAYKDLARRLVRDINDGGIECFYAGHIPEDIRDDVLDAIVAALHRSAVFMPFIGREYAGSRSCGEELTLAISDEKFVIPIALDPDYIAITPGGFLTGIRITDMSSSAKYEKEFPQLLSTIQTMTTAAAAAANVPSGGRIVSDDQDDDSNGDSEDDDDDDDDDDD